MSWTKPRGPVEFFRNVLVFLVIVVLLHLLFGCHGRVRRLPETSETVEGYAVTWPEDASTNAADYHTTIEAGRMRTTTPLRQRTEVE